jgi:hypothetical protein
MTSGRLPLPRTAAEAVGRAMRVFPVTVIMGARQTSKTTLAGEVSRGSSHAYVTLDDIDIRDRA